MGVFFLRVLCYKTKIAHLIFFRSWLIFFLNWTNVLTSDNSRILANPIITSSDNFFAHKITKKGYYF